MGVRAQKCVCLPAAAGDEEKLCDPWAPSCKGWECPQEIQTERFMFAIGDETITGYISKKIGSHQRRDYIAAILPARLRLQLTYSWVL